MSHPTLRLFGGTDNTTPGLRDEVQALQTLLNQDGASLSVDGLFGRDTEAAVLRFQNEHGLADDVSANSSNCGRRRTTPLRRTDGF